MLSGYLTCFAYCGLIYSCFWAKMLPPHLQHGQTWWATKQAWATGLASLVFMWCWLCWADRSVFWVVVRLHAVVDFAMVWTIRCSMFVWD
jgi:hypothetical protein